MWVWRHESDVCAWRQSEQAFGTSTVTSLNTPLCTTRHISPFPLKLPLPASVKQLHHGNKESSGWSWVLPTSPGFRSIVLTTRVLMNLCAFCFAFSFFFCIICEFVKTVSVKKCIENKALWWCYEVEAISWAVHIRSALDTSVNKM